MSGKNSRARRKIAIHMAKNDLYINKGRNMVSNPFSNERQSKIYEKYYLKYQQHYWNMEAELNDLEEVYGKFTND